MQSKSTQRSDYRMIIRLIDNPSILTLPEGHSHQTTQFQHHHSPLSDTSHKRTINTVAEPAIYQKTSFPIHTHHKSLSCQLNIYDTSSLTGNEHWMKYSQHKKTNDSEGTEKSKCSIINELSLVNMGSETLTFKFQHFGSLDSIDCIQAMSVHEDDSYDFDQADSEVVSLSSDQKEFFQRFVGPQIQQNRELQQLFKRLSLQPPETAAQKTSEGKAFPQNKLKIIRNFFKPKEAVPKDQNTGFSTKMEHQLVHSESKSDLTIGKKVKQHITCF